MIEQICRAVPYVIVNIIMQMKFSMHRLSRLDNGCVLISVKFHDFQYLCILLYGFNALM